MRIVIYSSTFLPNIGGLENIMAGLAEEWTNMGHDVVVYTSTDQSNNKVSLSFPIIFKTSNAQLNKAIAEADIYLEANISLKNCVPGLLNRKKWFVIHHIQYDHQGSWTAVIKNQLSKLAKNISVSQFIAQKLPTPSTVIHNFCAPNFKRTNFDKRKYDLVFLGRLVSDKGVDRLLKALESSSNNYSCLIIGEGEEKIRLQELVKKLNLTNRVHFGGSLSGESLVEALNSATVMVIPSIWDEPFGVVALEGLTCGCLIACSNKSGLIEATGNLSSVFDPVDLNSIKDALHEALVINKSEEYQLKINRHLQNHSRTVIAKKYIEVFENSGL